MAFETPRATYRLQLHPGFAFDDAAGLADYLAQLGISHAYCSPYLAARSGSQHGYDIVDYGQINPELGGEAGLERLVAALRKHELGHILDFVPNHMGVGGHDNDWWLDVLEWGEDSPYAAYFDIDWHPANPSLAGKVLLPFLGAPYGDVLERGELQLAFSAAEGAVDVWFYEHRFPIALRHYPRLLGPALTQLRQQRGEGDPAVGELTEIVAALKGLARRPGSAQARRARRQAGLAQKARLAALAGRDSGVTAAIDAALARWRGTPGDLASFEALNRLLDRQPYRLAWWRTAGDEVNYRRFFDINDLAGLRMENPALFDTAHRKVLELIADGKLDGLRLDHVDGLFDPAGYFRKLQDRCCQAAGLARPPRQGRRQPAAPFYVVAEKILGQDEALPANWPIAGTTGYDFLSDVTAVLVDPGGADRLDRLYRRLTGDQGSFGEVLAASKRRVMNTELAGELEVLATDLWHIAQQGPRTRDYTLNGLRDGLREVVIHFPVYRSYVTRTGANAHDRHNISTGMELAKQHRPEIEPGIFDFIGGCLTGDLARQQPRRYNRNAVLAAARKAQQFTGPVMAKGFEDTALYRYPRLLALNDVGCDPRRLGLDVAGFHSRNEARSRLWPHGMLATATHDTKRGEDVRARLAVLAEMPGTWQAQLRSWQRLANGYRQPGPAPDNLDSYLIFQTLVGAWPLRAGPAPESLADFEQRLHGYLEKALREAKRHTEWANPNLAYERACQAFVTGLLGDDDFLAAFRPFQRQVAFYGMLNGLTQTALKLASPGVPDIYQGSELWDLNLVDPDNRRPVDFAARRQMLAGLQERYAGGWPDSGWLAELLQGWPDGRIKLLLIWRLLAVRRHRPELFGRGTYVPLRATGAHRDRVLAFARQAGSQWLVVAVPRLSAGLVPPETPPVGELWSDTALARPRKPRPPGELVDRLSGRRLSWGRDGLPLAEALGDLPVAALTAG